MTRRLVHLLLICLANGVMGVPPNVIQDELAAIHETSGDYGSGSDYAPIVAEWQGALLIGDEHTNCAHTTIFTSLLRELEPRPDIVFLEFLKRTPPTSRDEIMEEYVRLTNGYQCGKEYADLVLETGRLGIKAVGLYNKNITVANLGTFWYMTLRANGVYDQWVRTVIEEYPDKRYTIFIGSEHANNQRFLYSKGGECKHTPEKLPAYMLEEGAYIELPCVRGGHNACETAWTCTGRDDTAKVGPWAIGCENMPCSL